jgi:hypothetical protein
MPCGGIWPASVENQTGGRAQNLLCWHCNKPKVDHCLEEFDSYIHGSCVHMFLRTEEGQIVVEHKHHIQVDGTVLQREGELNETLLVRLLEPERRKYNDDGTKRDLRPRSMRTVIGKKLHFELRPISLPNHKGKMRCVWIVVYEDKVGHTASVEEVRLWKALPNKMRVIERTGRS